MIMKISKKVLSLFIALVMIITALPMNTLSALAAASKTPATITVESNSAMPNSTVNVNVIIKDNPGIVGASITVNNTDELTLVDANSGPAFEALSFAKPGSFSNKNTFVWDAETVTADDIKDGVILTLSYKISASAKIDSNYPITVDCEYGDVINAELEPVETEIVNGDITVIDYMPGDVNQDGKITTTDVVFIRRYMTGGYTLNVFNENAADVNADGKINTTDIVMIRRYIVDGCKTDPNGYNVTLKPSTSRHIHTMEAIEKTEATCTEEGNIAYWYCTDCGNYYADAKGLKGIDYDSTIINTGHTLTHVESKAATTESEGILEHWFCTRCEKYFTNSNATTDSEIAYDKLIVEKIKKEESTVIYNIYGSDTYLEGLGVNNPNPATFAAVDGLVLNDLIAPQGYVFKGWQTSSGIAIDKIEPGSPRQIVLNACWEKKEYTVQFDSPDVPVESIKYTVDTGVPLINPAKQFGYTFVGWSNNDGFLVSSIKPGTVGNITLHANWTSNRNKATSYDSYDEPMIIEDDTNGQFMFVYNIGKIDNVPLSQISYLGNSDGIEIDQQYDVSSAVTEETAKQVANTVANATTKSSGWTLSDEWEKIYEAGNETEEQKGKTTVRTDSEGNVTGGNYYVSNSSGGSSFVSNSSGGSSSSSSKVTTNNSVGINRAYDNKNSSYVDAKLGVSNTTEVSAGVSVPIKIAKVEAGVKNSTTVSAEVAGGLRNENSQHYDDSYSGSVGTYKENNSSSYYNSVAEKSSTWNSTSGYEKSYQTSRNTEVSKAISEQISKKTTLNVTDAVSGSKSTNATDTYTDSSSEEYSSSVRYNSENKTTTSQGFKYSSTEQGYYRLVNAGTVHVFAVVAYDVATSSYYTYTYNVLDDERHIYTDFSLSDPNFKDCENGVVSFEIPYEVNEYVVGLTGRSNGLQFSLNGTVTKYTSSTTDETVVVPQYYSANNGADNSKTAIKVTKISPTAFKGNKNIKTVVLPLYVDEIPDGAFEGCSNLENVIAFGVTKIGANAFKGCTNLTAFSIDNMVTSLGNNAFENVDELRIQAANEAVFDAALTSGAKRLTINTSRMIGTLDNKAINIASDKDYFALLSNGTKFNNFQISSKANETYISNMILANNTDTPLKLNSAKVTLNRVVVEKSPGFALILENDNTELSLYGTVDLGSSSENAILSKNISLAEENAEVASEVNVFGDALVCGNIKNDSMLSVTDNNNNAYEHITEEEFNNYLTSSKLTFEPNGGDVSTTNKTVYYGQDYGELPTPTRENYIFDGWFTSADGGTYITADTTVTALVNQTLYAHWTPKKFNVTFDANGGNVSVAAKELSYGDNLGELPIPIRDYHRFDGWYTEIDGGIKVSESIIPDVAENITIYAHWSENSVSDWVMISEMPTDAEVVNKKYSYTQRSYSTSGSSSMTGWTKYDTKRAYWDKTIGPVYSNPSNGSRNVWSEQYVSGYEKKTEYNYTRYSNKSSGGTRFGPVSGTWSGIKCTNKQTRGWGSKLNVYDTQTSNQYKAVYGKATFNCYGKSGNPWYNETSRKVDDKNKPIKKTRWYYQDPVYTYYYYKDEDKESTTIPNGDNISNVQEWVQYRVK